MNEFDFPEFKTETRRWMFWLARIFGKRVTGKDSDCEVVLYYWRGKMWAVQK